MFYVLIFRELLGNRIFFIFALASIASLSESIGILMLLPILLNSAAGEGGNSFSSELADIFNYLFGFFNLPNTLENSVLLLCLFFVLKGVFYFLSQFLILYYRALLQKKIKEELLETFSTIDYRYYAEQSRGYLASLINEQTFKAVNCYNSLNLYIAGLLSMVIYLCFAFIVEPYFSGIAILVGGILFLGISRLNARVRKLSVRGAELSSVMNGESINLLNATKYLRATNQFKKRSKVFLLKVDAQKQILTNIALASSFVQSIREPVAVLMVMALLYSQMVYFGSSLETILVAIALFYRTLSSMLTAQVAGQKMYENAGSLEVVSDALENIVIEPNLTSVTPIFDRCITFKSVSLQYGEKQVLVGLNLTIRKNETIALVGESGAGKTTLVDMLTGIVRPSGGRLYVDDMPLDELSMATWRDEIGYVAQDPMIFPGSFLSNIVGESELENIKDELIVRAWQALEAANIAQYVRELPEGIFTAVGDAGAMLSGGQRQRLAIAREIFRSPQILILDEATSALDAENENAIQEAVQALKDTMTIIIIAHRLATVKSSDTIYVLDQGEIKEHGTYRDLINKTGSRFELMARSQGIVS